MTNVCSYFLLGALLSVTLPGFLSAQEDATERLAEEESINYYQKWLEEDVVYIITSDEESVFRSLTTDEERERFIEQFWQRRDPDLTTSANEYKEEHYRRIAYANDHFESGIEGWRSDRGRIYIIHGPPHQIQSFTAGHKYNRPKYEGGGSTRTYPFEIWRYRHLEGIGDDVELEFVDRSMSGSFELAITPWQKDMLLSVPGLGQTLAEEFGMQGRQNHPYYNQAMQDQELYPFLQQRAKDDPFARMETFFHVQRPEQIKYKDLKEQVEISINFDQPLDFDVRYDHFRLNEAQTLVPITLQWDNRELTFQPEGDLHRARIAVYGIVTGMSNEIVTEFDADVMAAYAEEDLPVGRLGKSMYQKVLSLQAGGRYKLTLISKDLNSDKAGVEEVGILLPRYGDEELKLSPLILSSFIRRLDNPDLKRDNLSFVLGDLWVRPSMENLFTPGDQLGTYLQVYGASIDQETLQPALEVTYEIFSSQGEAVVTITDPNGQSIDHFSGQRVVLLKVLLLKQLPPDTYKLRVHVRDKIDSSEVTATQEFEVADTSMASN